MRSDERETLGPVSGEEPCEPVPPVVEKKEVAPPVERREVAPPPRRTPGRRRALWAILVAAIIIVAAAVAALALNGNNLTPNNDNPSGGVSQTPLAVNSPQMINQTAANLTVSAGYPGQGQLSSYAFTRGQSNAFQVTTTPINGYKGSVLTKIFVQRDPGGIAQEGIQDNYGNNQSTAWSFNYINGTHWGSSDIGPVWQSDGTSTHQETVNLIFNRTGTYNVTLQSFDPNTGKAISQPLIISPISVPENGTLTITQIGSGERVTINGQSYYKVVTNITNDWNLRRDVNSSDLRVYSKSAGAAPDLTATAFTAQNLDIGQSTQFDAYYKISDDPTQMYYQDHVSGQTIGPIALNNTKAG